MHAIQERPVAVDDQVVIRPMMYVALTYDHRIVDGREAVTFLKRVKELIERPGADAARSLRMGNDAQAKHDLIVIGAGPAATSPRSAPRSSA